jgi:hypothetical protein
MCQILIPDIVIEDIAWALSRMPRFSGHSIPYVPYSVAQHCIQVAEDLKELWPRHTVVWIATRCSRSIY